MKLDARRVPAFLRNPGEIRVVLLHGEDHGLIRERAEALVRAVAGALDDPFRVVDLARDGFARIPEETSALSLIGGRRVVRVREATDAATVFVSSALERPGDALLVLEGGGLAPRSRLRALLERLSDTAAIACYREEGGALARSIGAMLAELSVTVEPEALEWLVGQLGADRVSTRSEVEKMALYAGASAFLDLTAAMACVGDMAGLELDDALFAATAGQVVVADRALELAMAQGVAPVGVLRASLTHLQRLQRAKGAMTDGLSAVEAAKAARPPIFYRRTGAFTAALECWSPEALSVACAMVWEAERACKQTGAPGEMLCRQAIGSLARRAARNGK